MSNHNNPWKKFIEYIKNIDLQLLSKLIVAAVVLIVFTAYIATQLANQKIQAQKLEEFEEKYSEKTVSTPINTSQKVLVDVKGAVKNPNIYKLTTNDRVKDAIDAAGGFTNDADKESVNLAEKLKDEMEILVKSKNKNTVSHKATVKKENKNVSKAVATINNKVNINTATAEQLMMLPEIGPTTAKAIIDYRNYKGSFKAIEHIMRVKGIGNATYEKLKDYITV